jgi:hypothetical protein
VVDDTGLQKALGPQALMTSGRASEGSGPCTKPCEALRTGAVWLKTPNFPLLAVGWEAAGTVWFFIQPAP